MKSTLCEILMSAALLSCASSPPKETIVQINSPKLEVTVKSARVKDKKEKVPELTAEQKSALLHN